MLEDGECAAFLSPPVFSVYVVRHMASRERAVGIDRKDEPGSVSPDKGRHHLLCPTVLPKPIKPSQLFCEAVEDHRPYREKEKERASWWIQTLEEHGLDSAIREMWEGGFRHPFAN